EEREFYQLTDNQKRLWIINQLEPGSSAYNIVGKIAINHEIDLSALRQAIYTIIQRHHSLRTGFKWVDGAPVQWVQKRFTLPLDIIDISDLDEPVKLAHQEELWAKNMRFVFDPGNPPLFRSVLVQLEAEHCEIIFCMHHLISDGWSLEILKQEFFRLYEGYREGKEVQVEPLPLQYKDAAAWQNKRLQDGGYIKKAQRFWRRIIGEGFGVLRLPRDDDLPQSRAETQGAGYRRVIKKDIAAALKQVARDNHTSLFVVMCSAFNILLSYLSDQREIFLGIPAAGREHVSLQHMVGFFLNTLVMKSSVHEEERFIDYLDQVNRDTMAALQYQGCPLERILSDLKMPYPVIPVMFNMLNMREIQAEEAAEALESTRLPGVQDVKNDMNIYITEYINSIEVSWHYRQKMFKPETIEYMTGEYLNLLQAISINPLEKIKHYQVCSRKSLEIKGNSIQPPNEFSEFKKEALHQSLVHRFEEQVADYPWNTAVKTHNGHFTYKELNILANQAAHGILAINSRKRGAALLFEHDIHMIVGMLGALKAGTFYVPLDPGYPAKRLIYMLKDSNVNILLTNNPNKSLAGKLIQEAGHEIRLVNLDDLAASTAKENVKITISPGDPAYVLYTSGSTGIPKGVMQNHRNVLHFIRVYTNQLHIHTRDRLTLFSSYSFDAAVMDIYGALCNGAALYPFDMKQEENPGRLSSWLEDEKITIFHSIPTVFRYFTDLLTGAEKFSALRLLVMGGEAVYQQDVEKYKKHFPGTCLFINGLGPTESTVTLQYFIDKKMEITRQAVPVGFPLEETNVYLLKDNDEEARIYEKGEIVFESDYLAVGYLNQPERTSEVFTVNPLTDRGKIYRSGDLGIRLHNGAIEYQGRKDDQVKIKGYRVELGEIESTLDKVAGIKKSVVVSRQTSNGENYLAAYYRAGIETEINENNIRNILNDSLPGFMIPHVFIPLEDFPLTPTGKIDRQALPKPDEAHVLAAQNYHYGCTAPENQIEEKMVHIWKQLLDMERISTGANFFQLGGHSLTAALLAARIFKEFNVKIPLKEIFLNPFIKELSKYINESVKAQYMPIKAVEKMEYYPLSSAQKRIYILQQMAPASISYNISNAFVLEGDLDLAKLEAVFCQLTRRHVSLRTSFAAVDEEPVQKVHDKVEFGIEYFGTHELHELHEKNNKKFCRGPGGGFSKEPPGRRRHDDMIKSFIRPFDLSRVPLLRVGLIKAGHKKYILVIDVHHIIADGMSLGIIARDLRAMYHGKTLPALRLQYRDYSQWQKGQKESVEIKQQEEFWLNKFPGELPVLNLPTDFKRPDIQNFAGSSWSFELDDEDTKRLKTLASEKDATLFMVLFSLYNVWLAKISGQEDIIVGTPAAGRNYPGLENITGMFVNTLALRNYPSGQQTFEEFLKEVRQGILPAFENQDYPFENLVEHLWQHRDSSRNPLFDVMFTFQNLTGPGMEIPGLTLTPYPYQNQISKFDINLDSIDKGERLAFTLQYCEKLFKKSTIERYARYFNQVVSSVLADHGQKLGSIEIITKTEKSEILNHFNDTVVKYPLDRVVKVLFEEQVSKTPRDTAAVFTGETLNYLELNEKANQLAYRLMARGIGSGSLVPVLMDQSLELLISFLAIMKAGAAFVPLDVRWPLERIKMILADIGAEMILANPLTPYNGKQLEKETIIAASDKIPTRESKKNPLLVIDPQSPIYAMYTSGATGKPKGVLIPHRGITNRLLWMNDYFGIETAAVVLQTTRYVYDSVVWQFFWPLINGGKTIILPPDFVMSAHQLAYLVETYRVTITDFVPSVFTIIVDQLLEDPRFQEKLKSLQEVILGAEEIIPAAVYKFMKAFPGIRLTNLYGPTETSIGCIYHPVSGDEGDKIPIGRPIANVRVYILDLYMKLVPVGIAGEIFIAGIGVGHGYLNETAKTANSFLNNPFSPGKKWYRTGDMGKWRADGRIDFLGRIDLQVKIRGVRIELAEIENTLRSHQDIKDALVIAREKQKNDKYLCAYIVPYLTPANENELKSYLAGELPAYMIPNYFVTLDRIPLTPAGKVDRKSLPQPEFTIPEPKYRPPRDKIEEKLQEIWCGVLGLESSPTRIGIDADFFELGGNSLTAMTMIAKIHKELDVNIPLSRVFKTPHLAKLSDYIREGVKDRYVSIEPVETNEYYEPSFNQKRLWFLHQLEPDSPRFNLSGRMVLRHRLDPDILKQILHKMIERHESFRTGFRLINEEPVQYVVPRVEFPFRFIDLSSLDENSRKRKQEEIFTREKERPFDLYHPPIFRSILLKIHDRHYDLIFNMHHIISDGWSLGILEREFFLLYDACRQEKDIELPPLKIRYKDFTGWQTRQCGDAVLKEQYRGFWRKKLEEGIPVMELPRDFSKNNNMSAGEVFQTAVKEEIKDRLKKLAEKNHTTLFMVLFSAYVILLSRLSERQDQDIVCMIMAAGRDHVELHNVVGFFVNAIIIKTRVESEDMFTDLLHRVENDTLQALQHQGYPLELLCQDLKLRYPDIPVAFNMLNLPEAPGQEMLPRFSASQPPGRNIQGALFDLEPYVSEYQKSIEITWRYRKTAFKPETIENIAQGYLTLLEEISWLEE
ncbi:MAG: amino acid adenylation domain-containing protein, partial [Candidatus Aminicenantes bacterium]